MPQLIDITNDEIRYAETLLLPFGKTFDDEYRTFIRNFNTIDLQAVPGSGKTTALLAKLLILERKLPFYDSSVPHRADGCGQKRIRSRLKRRKYQKSKASHQRRSAK